MVDNPFTLFSEWYELALENNPLMIKSAACLSTIDQHGYPDGRFVDLKEFTDQGFIFCTALNSAKGLSIANNPKVALTFWWDHVGRQIRISGTAYKIGTTMAEECWHDRPRSARLTTWACKQSEPLDSFSDLEERVDNVVARFDGQTVPRPDDWGGYLVVPAKMEFLLFKQTRLHERTLFTANESGWEKRLLQP